MKLFIREHSPKFRTVSKVADDQSNIEFTKLWQEKKYTEALENYFPKNWEWIGRDIKKQLICDYPMNHGTGEVVSEKLFNVLREKFPIETALNHSLKIEALNYFWFSPPVIESSDILTTNLNIFIAKPKYITMYSENYTNLLKDIGVSGHDFVEIKK